MINKEDFDCAFIILELQTNVLILKLQQIKLEIISIIKN